MGYPGKNYKQYATPKRRFEKTRLEDEKRLIIEYGLRNKREVWKAQNVLRNTGLPPVKRLRYGQRGPTRRSRRRSGSSSSTTFSATASSVKTLISATSSP